jgi:hypothetical protein
LRFRPGFGTGHLGLRHGVAWRGSVNQVRGTCVANIHTSNILVHRRCVGFVCGAIRVDENVWNARVLLGGDGFIGKARVRRILADVDISGGIEVRRRNVVVTTGRCRAVGAILLDVSGLVETYATQQHQAWKSNEDTGPN